MSSQRRARLGAPSAWSAVVRLACTLLVSLPACRTACVESPGGNAVTDASIIESSRAPAPEAGAPRAADADWLITGDEPDRPDQGPFWHRSLRLKFDHALCAFDLHDPVARCRPTRAGRLVAAADGAPGTLSWGNTIYDAGGEALFAATPPAFADGYRLENGSLLVLVVDRGAEGRRQPPYLLRVDRAGAVQRTTVTPPAREIEAWRLLGEWLLLGERVSGTDHRILALPIRDGGRAIGAATVVGVFHAEHRSTLRMGGDACRSPDGLSVSLTAQSEELEPGTDYALAMLSGGRWTLVLVEGALDSRLSCSGQGATLTAQQHGGIVQWRCDHARCTEVSGALPSDFRHEPFHGIGALGDGVLAVWGSTTVRFAAGRVDELAGAQPSILYTLPSDDGVRDIDVFSRGDYAFVLLRTARGVRALRVDASRSARLIRAIAP